MINTTFTNGTVEGPPALPDGCDDAATVCLPSSLATPSPDSVPEPSAANPTSAYPTPAVLQSGEPFIWDDDAPSVENYVALGERLNRTGDLYRRSRYASGLLLASPSANVPPMPIVKATDLAAIIMDRVRVQVVKDGKPKGSRIAPSHLGTMLATEVFLQQFSPIDTVTQTPLYLPDFLVTQPRYNDGGAGHRVFYAGSTAEVAEGMETIRRFLDVMPFASNADRSVSFGQATSRSSS